MDRLKLLYEPVVELESGRAVGFQAVLQDPNGGEGDATSLRPVAVGVGRATAAADRLLGRAMSDAAAINAEFPSAEGLFSASMLGAPAAPPRLRGHMRAHLAGAA